MFGERVLRAAPGESCATDERRSSPCAASRSTTGRTRSCTASTLRSAPGAASPWWASRAAARRPWHAAIAGIHPGKIDGRDPLSRPPLERDSRARPKESRQHIQYIFQSPYGSLNPRKTIGQILSQPLKQFFELSRDEMEERMAEALELVALDGSLLGKYPDS